MLENKEIEGPSSESTVVIERRGLDPWTLYLYAMKSPATKEEYLMRLGKFLDFLNLQKGDTLQDKSRAFANFLGTDTTFLDVQLKEQITSFLDTKIKNVDEDPDKKWITTWNDYLHRIKHFLGGFTIRKM